VQSVERADGYTKQNQYHFLMGLISF